MIAEFFVVLGEKAAYLGLLSVKVSLAFIAFWFL